MLRSILAAMLLLLTIVETSAGGRVALVVGVSNYEYAGRLTNTLNDANDMGSAEAIYRINELQSQNH
jgi:hypothetical protein